MAINTTSSINSTQPQAARQQSQAQQARGKATGDAGDAQQAKQAQQGQQDQQAQQANKPEQSKPVVNTQGQVTGKVINITA